jgi:hypothetical protein
MSSSSSNPVPEETAKIEVVKFVNLDLGIERLHLKTYLEKYLPLASLKYTRKIWVRTNTPESRSRKWMLDDKKVILSGDLPLGVIPFPTKPPLVLTDEDHMLMETWIFVNELYEELKQAGPKEVHKLKKLRRKIAAPLIIALHLIMFIIGAKLRGMRSEMSEQKFDECMSDGEARHYLIAVDRTMKRFNVVKEELHMY